MQHYIEYEIIPCANVPEGLPSLTLAVLSPIWRGASLELEYPDGEVRTLVGWQGTGAGQAADLRVFWTRAESGGPPVCLAIGGNAGVRDLGPPGGAEFPRGRPFLALAESLIPQEVLTVIGPPPPTQEVLLLT